MLAFLYETLSDEEKKTVEKHLLTCLRCRMIMRKITGLKKAMEEEPKPAVGKWAEVKWEMAEKKRADNPAGRFFSFLHRSFALQAGLAAAAVLFLVLVVFRVQTGGEKMTVVKATGNVTVNNVSFFKELKTTYDLGKKLELTVKDGECVFQLGGNSLIIAEKGTVLTVEDGRVLKVSLVQGNVIAKIDRSSGHKTDMTIRTPRGEFVVTKAVFYIRSEKDFTECGVREGELRTASVSGIPLVPEKARLTIGRSGRGWLAKLDGNGAEFTKLDTYTM